MRTSTDSHTMEARLHALELQAKAAATSARRARTCAGITVLIAGALTLLAATDISRVDTLRTHRLEILDSENRVVLAATADTKGGRLDLWSNTGANLARMAANDQGGDLAIWNAGGASVAGIWASKQGGAMACWTDQGHQAASLSSHEGGQLAIGGPAERASIQASQMGIRLRDGDGQERVLLSAGSMALHGPSGVAGLILNGSDQPSLSLHDDRGGSVAATVNDGEGQMHVASSAYRQTMESHALHIRDAEHLCTLSADGQAWTLSAGEEQLRLQRGGGLHLSRHDHTYARLDDVDGRVALMLTGPSGQAMLGAGVDSGLMLQGEHARVDLIGNDTESVMLASGAQLPIMTTSDEAITLHALKGAGRMLLGSGEGGRVRITGGTDGGRPAVDLLATDGTRVASMSTTSANLGLFAAANADGQPMAILHADPAGCGQLSIAAPNGVTTIGMGDGGNPALSLQDQRRRTLATMAATTRGGAINLMNDDGTPVVLAGITADGPGGAAAFQNGFGDTVVAAGSTADNQGQVIVQSP